MSDWGRALDLLIRADLARCIHDQARDNRARRPGAQADQTLAVRVRQAITQANGRSERHVEGGRVTRPA